MKILMMLLAAQVSAASMSVGPSGPVTFTCDGQVVSQTHDFSTCVADVSMTVSNPSSVSINVTNPPADAGFPDTGVVPDSGVVADAGSPDAGPGNGLTYDCNAPLANGWGTRHQMTVNGEVREVYVPWIPAYSYFIAIGLTDFSAHIHFHGGGGTPELYIPEQNSTAWDAGAIIFAPASRTMFWNDEVDANIAFYDAITACIPTWVPDVNPMNVSVSGFSAGAYFAGLIAGSRGDTISRALLFSGGIVPNVNVDRYRPGTVPVAIISGGSSDVCCGLSFPTESDALNTLLINTGHPTIRCDAPGQGWGHEIPPAALDANGSVYYDFMLGDGSGLLSLSYCQ